MMDVNEVLPVTITTFNRIMEEGGWKTGADAFALYFRYIVQSRLQNEMVTDSSDSFMKVAMGWWGWPRFSSAKKLLKYLWLIEAIKDRDGGGAISSWKVKVNLLVPDWVSTRSIETVVVDTTRIPETVVVDWNRCDPIPDWELTRIPETQLVAKRTTNIYNSNNNIIISNIHKIIKKYWFTYPSEQPFLIFNLMKDKSFLEVAESFGWAWELTEYIMEYSMNDEFWKGKVTSLKHFYYKWNMLYNQAKAKWFKAKKSLSEDDSKIFQELIDNA